MSITTTTSSVIDKPGLEAVALTIRLLSADAIEKAQSGHPGLPLGCAEPGALIYGQILKHYPGDPQWINRDRFVLSAGHGSMLLYSLLYLSGYKVSLEDIKAFRQLGSITPGHPEYRLTPGVETTTGPLGQGFGNAVGLAMAERMPAARFNTESHPIIDHYTYVLAGDGDLMEGVVYEAASLAGHLGLGKLIVFYDSNGITIDGGTELSFSEDVLARFQACGWQTLEGDAYDPEGILKLVAAAKEAVDRPSLIMLRSTIAEGCPKAVEYFRRRREDWQLDYRRWQELFKSWCAENPQLYQQWRRLCQPEKQQLPKLPEYHVGQEEATRVTGGKILADLIENHPELVGGSADLTVPCFGPALIVWKILAQ